MITISLQYIYMYDNKTSNTPHRLTCIFFFNFHTALAYPIVTDRVKIVIT